MLLNLKAAIAVRGLTPAEFALGVLKIARLSEIIHERKRADASLRARIAEKLESSEAWLFISEAAGPGTCVLDENNLPAAVLAGAER